MKITKRKAYDIKRKKDKLKIARWNEMAIKTKNK